MYILIETADVEILGVRVFTDAADANKVFETCMQENQVMECFDISHEIQGTIRLAGDDSYAVQLIERKVLV